MLAFPWLPFFRFLFAHRKLIFFFCACSTLLFFPPARSTVPQPFLARPSPAVLLPHSVGQAFVEVSKLMPRWQRKSARGCLQRCPAPCRARRDVARLEMLLLPRKSQWCFHGFARS